MIFVRPLDRLTEIAGEPELPTHSIRVPLPPRSTGSLQILSVDEGIEPGLVPTLADGAVAAEAAAGTPLASTGIEFAAA